MRRLRSVHGLAGLLAGPLILVAAGTALGLNHQDVVRGAVAPPTGGPYGKYVLAAAADPRDGRRLLVGTSDGVFRTADGGATWDAVALPVRAEQAGAIAFDPARPGVVYVAVRGAGVWRSADGGAAWQAVPLPFDPHAGVDVAALALAPDGGLVLVTPGGTWRQARGAWAYAPAAPRPAAESAGKQRLRLLYDLHDGRFWRDWGVPLTDAVALVLIALVLSGYALWGRTWWARRRAA